MEDSIALLVCPCMLCAAVLQLPWTSEKQFASQVLVEESFQSEEETTAKPYN